jgi:hypothetical protein
MKKIITLVVMLSYTLLSAQVNYGTPTDNDIPEKLRNLKKTIVVKNFPVEIDPIKIKDQYYWKHNTLVFHKDSAVKIIEFGAYLFYNGKWNLRKSYPLKDFNKNFGTKREMLLQAQPYTWNNNWRVGPQLFGGWALWYFIGVNEKGEKICGYEKINTTNNLIKS